MFDDDSRTRQEIRRLQKKVKKSPLLFARLGECYLRLGDWDHAEKILTKGVKEQPGYTTGLLVLGEGYLYAGFYRDAEECAQNGLEKDSTHLGLLRLMEKIKKHTDKDKELQRIKESLRSLDPLLMREDSSEELAEGPPTERWEDSALEPMPADLSREAAEDSTLESRTEEAAEPSATEHLAEVEDITEEKSKREAEEVSEDKEKSADAVMDDLMSARMTEKEIAQFGDPTEAEKEFAEGKAGEETEKIHREAEDSAPEIQSEETEEIADRTDLEDATKSVDADQPTEDEGITREKPKEEAEEVAKEVEVSDDLAQEEPAPAAEERETADVEASTEKDDEPEPPDSAKEEEPDHPKTKIATKTLGELYATQKKYNEAIDIYTKLIENDPTNEAYKERLEELKSRRDAALSESVESTDE